MKFTSLILLLATARSALVRPARPLRTAPSVTLHRTPAPVAVSSLAVQGVALNTVLAGAGTLKGQKMLTNSGLANGWLLGVILWSVCAAPKFARPANAAHTHRTTRRADARLARLDDGKLVAFGQKCTHLQCAVTPDVGAGKFVCPCHKGYFDIQTGRPLAGPPRRPLPRITLNVGDDGVIYATGVELST